MKFRRVLWGVGAVTRLFSVALLVPVIPALFMDDNVARRTYNLFGQGVTVPETLLIFVLSSLIAAFLGLFLEWLGEEEENLRDREGYAIVAVGWLFVTAVGTLPFLLSGAIDNLVDAWFETMSGLTTTGSSVMELPLEQYPDSIMFYRSFLQWLGGLGIIVLSVAVLSKLTHGGARLMQAEFSGTAGGRLRPKIAQTAKLLWGVYLIMTVVGALIFTGLLLVDGLDPGRAIFEGIVHTFTALASGGFSTRTDSIGAFGQPVQWFTVLLMFAAGVSFVLHFQAMRERSLRAYWRNPEFRFFLILFLLATTAVTGILYRAGEAASDSLRLGMFHVATALTNTGFATAVFDDWPDAARLLLVFLMITGGSVGSTSGAIKAARVLILLKMMRREIQKLLHPKAVLPVRLGDTVLGDDALKSISGFFFAYLTFFIFGTMFLTLLDLDIISAASAVAACMGNVGPGLGTVHLGYWDVPDLGKIALSLLMIIGRLEIFTILILVFPSTWRR